MARGFNPHLGGYRLARLLRPRLPRRQKIFVIIHAKSHVRLSIDFREILQAGDHSFTYVLGTTKSSNAANELKARGLKGIGLTNLVSDYRKGDLILTFIDWHPKNTLIASFRLLRKKGAMIVGINEGIRMRKGVQYERVRQLLAWGPVPRKNYSKPVKIVGSPVIENYLDKRWTPVDPPFALINYKFSFAQRDRNADWENRVTAACRDLGLKTVFSVHPTTRVFPDSIIKSDQEIADLLPECSVFLTPGSVTVFEALAIGVPVVLVPKHNENLGMLRNSGTSLPTSRDPGEIAEAIRFCLEHPELSIERGNAYLHQRISIDPLKHASVRTAEAIEEIAKGLRT